MRYILAIALAVVGAVMLTVSYDTMAQDGDIVRFEGDYTLHQDQLPVYYHDTRNHNSSYMWIWNPDNRTLPYGKHGNYTADPIHIGHWDIVHSHYNQSTIDNSILDFMPEGTLQMINYLLDQHDQQQQTIDQQQAQIDKLEKKVKNLEKTVNKLLQ